MVLFLRAYVSLTFVLRMTQWSAQLSAAKAALESVQAAIDDATILDASAANDLKQQQLNMKLKTKVREQKLQQRIGELEEELSAARKASEARDPWTLPGGWSVPVTVCVSAGAARRRRREPNCCQWVGEG